MAPDVGNGNMFLCQLVAGVLAVLTLLGLMLTSAQRFRHIKYWIALPCVIQAIPIAFVGVRISVRMSGTTNLFGPIWFASLGVLFFGFIQLAFWRKGNAPDEDSSSRSPRES
jgi:hypothetical protein